jgi:hypothetical protein
MSRWWHSSVRLRADKIYTVLFWAALMTVWAMAVWGGWADRTYERTGDRSPKWFWLELFGIPRSRRNCVRFLKGVSLFAMGLATVMMLVIMIWGK